MKEVKSEIISEDSLPAVVESISDALCDNDIKKEISLSATHLHVETMDYAVVSGNTPAAAKKDKRSRAANYTDQETRFLVNLVVENKEVIENKVSDAVMWKEKSDAWDKIAVSFNARNPENIHRDAATLKTKYETIKKSLKKKVTKQKTGSGDLGENISYKDWEVKLLAILKLAVHELSVKCDSDDVLNQQVSSPENNENNQTAEQPIHFTEVLLSDKNSFGSDIFEMLYDEGGDYSTISEKDIVVDVIPVCAAGPNSNEVEDKRTDDLGEISVDDNSAASKPKIPKKEILNSKYDALADDRRKLVLLQIEVAKKEMDLLNAKILREEEMRCLEKERLQNTIQYEHEEHQLKLKLLKQQLQ